MSKFFLQLGKFVLVLSLITGGTLVSASDSALEFYEGNTEIQIDEVFGDSDPNSELSVFELNKVLTNHRVFANYTADIKSHFAAALGQLRAPPKSISIYILND